MHNDKSNMNGVCYQIEQKKRSIIERYAFYRKVSSCRSSQLVRAKNDYWLVRNVDRTGLIASSFLNNLTQTINHHSGEA